MVGGLAGRRVRRSETPAAFGRFEAAACGDLWTADAWDGPAVAELAGRHAQLFSILDDHSRFLPHAAFYGDVGQWSFQRCLQAAIARRGIPRRLYIDNGSAFTSGQLKAICGRLGVQITHSAPGRPQGRGKKERVYRTIAEQFAVEVDLVEVTTLAQLNGYFTAWVEQVYHHRIHSSTGQSPADRWLSGPSSLRAAPDPDALQAAFRWTATRTVTRTATVSLHGNVYEVDPTLIGRKVQLVYDPTDLTAIDVNYHDRPAGTATPFEIGADQLTQLRLLTSLDADSPLALLLVGQPTLRRILRRGSHAALDQRIAVRFYLDPLDDDQAAGYIAHHMSLAGRSDPIFADDATTAIVNAARGLPRQIGNLAVAALIAGYTRNNRIVDRDCATAAIVDATTD